MPTTRVALQSQSPLSQHTIPVKLLDGMSPAEIAFRQGIPAHLIQALQTGALTDKTIQQIVLMPDCQTSVVYKLVADDGSALILKIVADAAWLRTEAAFLQTWHSFGVRTPDVYRRRSLNADGKVPFLLMEYWESYLAWRYPTRRAQQLS